jgi:hypothetical protein
MAMAGGGQAVATFESVGEAKAALARLQNFPIWGRQISLAFARDAPAAAAQHLDHRNLRPPSLRPTRRSCLPEHDCRTRPTPRLTASSTPRCAEQRGRRQRRARRRRQGSQAPLAQAPAPRL